MPRLATALLFSIFAVSTVQAQETQTVEPKFESQPAKEAVEKFNSEIERLNKALAEKTQQAREQLANDLKAVREEAGRNGDWEEATRITNFLNAKDMPDDKKPATLLRRRRKELQELRKQVVDLEKQNKVLSGDRDLLSFLVGKTYRTNHEKGRLWTFNSDGTLNVNGKKQGFWAILGGRTIITIFGRGQWVDKWLFSKNFSTAEVPYIGNGADSGKAEGRLEKL